MSNGSMTAAERQARALTATLIEALGPVIAWAQDDGPAGAASPALAMLLDGWRRQLCGASAAAVEPVESIIGLTALFALCEVRRVDIGPDRGIHIDGQAVAAFGAALRLVHFFDCVGGTTVSGSDSSPS